MKFVPIFLKIILLSVSYQLCAEDTTFYYQRSNGFFSNRYMLIRQYASDKKGRFIQESFTDDMQKWYGQGVFTETRHKIYLTFDTTKQCTRVELISCKEHIDTLYVKWFDWWGRGLSNATVGYSNSLISSIQYHSEWRSGFIKIPKYELRDPKLTLYALNSDRKMADFQITNGICQVNVYATDTVSVHTYKQKEVVIKKTKKGVKAIGMFVANKKVKFIRND